MFIILWKKKTSRMNKKIYYAALQHFVVFVKADIYYLLNGQSVKSPGRRAHFKGPQCNNSTVPF